MDVKSGKEVWKYKTGGEKWIGGKGYFGWKPVEEFSTDPWQFFLSSPVLDPNSKNPVLYFGSSDGNLYALDSKSGKLKWKFGTEGAIHSTPAIYKGKVFVGSWDSKIYAVDAISGKQIWAYQTGKNTGMTGIQASPALDDDKVYIGSRDGNFYALNQEDGSLVWTYPAENSWIIATAAAKDGVVYIGTSDTFSLIALNGKTGKEKFRVRGNGYVYSSPALLGNTAYFGDFTGRLFSVDLKSGQKNGVFETSARKSNAPKVLNEKDELDYMMLGKGKDLSIYKNNVEIMEHFYSLGSFVSSPVLGAGVLYIGSADGSLYAINLTGERIAEGGHSHH